MCPQKENQSLLLQNPKEIREELKVILGQYRILNASIRQRLEALGFTFTKRRGHYKVYYMHEHSRFCSMSVTASDRKTGVNTALKLFRYLVIPYLQELTAKKNN